MNDHLKATSIIVATVVLLSLCLATNAQSRKLPKQISGGILNGKATSLPKPEYPEDARKAKLSGMVSVQVLIDETGKVTSANAVSGLENVSLRLAAETAALQATFTPTLLSGEPVKVSGVINYNFIAEPSNETKLRVLSVSTFFAFFRAFAADPDKLNDGFETKDIVSETAEEFPEFSAQINALSSLQKLPVDKRAAAIDKAASTVRSGLPEAGKWQFDLGVYFGDIVGPLMFQMATNPDAPDLSQIDESSIRLNLNKMKDLTFTAPPDFPKDVLETLKILVALGEKDDLSTPENLRDFVEKMMAVIETISPESAIE